MSSTEIFDWGELAFGSKKPVSQLRATFIMAPRTMSKKRLAQLIKTYLPQGNIVLGIAKEPYVAGLEGQPQFTMLTLEEALPIADKVNAAGLTQRIALLRYNQRDIAFLLEKLDFARVVLVNGSWYRAFHLRPEFYTLTTRGIPFEKVSPFVAETEAKAYPGTVKLSDIPTSGTFTAADMLALANRAGTHSYDSGGFQIGVSLGRKKGKAYELLATTHNTVVPYETYALHHGASREQNFSPTNDLNHYDTVHAEVAMVIKAGKEHIDLHDTTLFINLLPCPMCARMFTQTDIESFVYSQDHSSGYGLKMLERAGKHVTRMVEDL
jgi:tRNA(Arg) A34 adenosine deaminase TadA